MRLSIEIQNSCSATLFQISYILFVASIKRLRDIGVSGFFVLLSFVPFVNLFLVLYLFFKPSAETGDKNKFNNHYYPATESTPIKAQLESSPVDHIPANNLVHNSSSNETISESKDPAIDTKATIIFLLVFIGIVLGVYFYGKEEPIQNGDNEGLYTLETNNPHSNSKAFYDWYNPLEVKHNALNNKGDFVGWLPEDFLRNPKKYQQQIAVTYGINLHSNRMSADNQALLAEVSETGVNVTYLWAVDNSFSKADHDHFKKSICINFIKPPKFPVNVKLIVYNLEKKRFNPDFPFTSIGYHEIYRDDIRWRDCVNYYLR